jgi:hypothetical protein
LALQRDSWCRLLTDGILRPSLGRLRPSASTTGRPDPHQAAAEQLLLEGLPPQLGQTVQVQRRRMEEMEQTVIAGVGKSEAADQAGDAGQVGAQAQSRQDDHQPQEGGGAGAGGAEGLEGAQPGQPEEV